MVTRTGCFSARASGPPEAGRYRAQLVDLPQQLFDPRTDLLALGLQALDFFGEAAASALASAASSRAASFSARKCVTNSTAR